MTWEELHDLFTELAEQFETKAYVTHQYGMSAMALHFVPVAWFISMKVQGDLAIGVYEGEEKHLRGTEFIPLAELTPEFVRERVGDAAREQLVQSMDFKVVRGNDAEFVHEKAFPASIARRERGGRRRAVEAAIDFPGAGSAASPHSPY